MWATILTAVLLILGVGVHEYAKRPDSPAEQIVEGLLKADGIDIDFSAEDKKDNK